MGDLAMVNNFGKSLSRQSETNTTETVKQNASLEAKKAALQKQIFTIFEKAKLGKPSFKRIEDAALLDPAEVACEQEYNALLQYWLQFSNIAGNRECYSVLITTYQQTNSYCQTMAIIERGGKCFIETKKEPIWWYHPDHLGSSSYLSDYSGYPSHYYNYLPFGEEMVSQNTSSYNNKYRFSGKELDEETGLSYFGARNYNPKWSIWLSVDPLAEKFPNASPYNYCLSNPINLVDPSGMSAENPGDIYSKSGKHLKNDGNDDHKVYVVNDNKINADQKWNANDQVEIMGLTNEQLLQTAASTNNEWENSFEGRAAIANTIINRMEKMNLTFDETMGSLAGSSVGSSHEGRMKSKWFSGYQDFINAGNSGRNNNSVFKSCLSATLDAYNGGFDYSNGSIGWQGTDFFSSQVRGNGKQWPAYLEYKAKGFKWDSNVLNGNGKYKLPNKELFINGGAYFTGKAYYGRNIFLNH